MVQFGLDREGAELLKMIPGFWTFNPRGVVFIMVKGVYGLKEGPRAWRQKLHLVLEGFALRALYVDAQLYVRHEQTHPAMILPASVDDVDGLKGGAPRKLALQLLLHLENARWHLHATVAQFHTCGDRSRLSRRRHPCTSGEGCGDAFRAGPPFL
eukprot:4905470-Pyramimonas_sp.AAC.1